MALSKNEKFRKTDLSCLKGCFSGADTLPRAVKEEFEEIVRKQGGNVKLLEGYGLTEAVTAIGAMPMTEYREGSIGVPFPDMRRKSSGWVRTRNAPRGRRRNLPVRSGGNARIPRPAGRNGEGSQKHSDGRVWLHTGEMATMNADGFMYFKQRIKRMIKSSGVNVYPGQVEDVLRQHPAF
jgi:long-chain acyl-CoA synthetase